MEKKYVFLRILEDLTPQSIGPLGQVLEAFTSLDAIARSCKLITALGIFTRRFQTITSNELQQKTGSNPLSLRFQPVGSYDLFINKIDFWTKKPIKTKFLLILYNLYTNYMHNQNFGLDPFNMRVIMVLKPNNQSFPKGGLIKLSGRVSGLDGTRHLSSRQNYTRVKKIENIEQSKVFQKTVKFDLNNHSSVFYKK